MFKCVNDIAPDYLCNEFYRITDVHDRVTRQSSANDLYVATVKLITLLWRKFMEQNPREYQGN